ncbi:MAG: VOC family protein [Caulobacterales bacterium]
MDQRVSFITLGVADVKAATAFYERLGWRRSPASQAEITFFDLGGMVLGLFGRASLAEDAKLPDSKPGFSGISLACNQRSEADVDSTIAVAVKAGAKLLKPAERVFWGGYSGYFADPDGHVWEIAFNPMAPLDAEGRVSL